MTDLEKQETSEVQQYQDYIPGRQSWDELTGESVQILGYDLAKKEYFDDLVGIEFIILRVTFTKGIPRVGFDYVPAKVSCECLTAPRYNLKKINLAREINELPKLDSLDELPFDPSSTIVFNDGSTGVYRQVVERLEFEGRITLPDVARNGAMGMSALDLPPSQWTIKNPEEFWLDDEGFMRYQANVRIHCPRGIRLSRYENEYQPDGSKTRYLA